MYRFIYNNSHLEKVLDFIKTIRATWQLAKIKTPFYENTIVNIECRNVGKKRDSLIYYRVIGARAITCASAEWLNSSSIFSKFPSSHAQMIVSLATIDKIINDGYCDSTFLENKKQEYIKSCQKHLKHKKVEK